MIVKVVACLKLQYMGIQIIKCNCPQMLHIQILYFSCRITTSNSKSCRYGESHAPDIILDV